MRRAIQLATLGDGYTSPNPVVGAVVLDKNGQLVGESFHPFAGGPHAEVRALSQAGENAKGGTLVVTLEPCCHFGRTPPCTKAILEFCISRVVVAMKDPDPRVAGKGIAFLKKSGLEVITGVLEEDAAFINREFIFRLKTGRPWGILKWAMSLDGRIALPNGQSQWISNKQSRSFVHSLRAKCDAVIVGGNTVRLDNPLLTSRGISNPEPIRVVLSNSLDFPKGSQIFETKISKTIIAHGPGLNDDLMKDIPDGPELLELELSEPKNLLTALAEKGCNRVLWECGPKLATAAIKQNCVQELFIVAAPKLIGGCSAMTPLEDFGFESISNIFTMENLSLKKLGDDFLLKMPLSKNTY